MLKVPGPNYYDPWADLSKKCPIRKTREWPAGTLPETGRKTEKTEIWSWKRPESKELSNGILGRVYRGHLLVLKIFDGSRTDMDDSTAEIIAKTR